MTHEELLAKIDAITGIKYNFETNVVTYGNPHGQHRFIVNQALRAVVELHKPLTPRKHMCDCNYCPPFDCEKCETFYPCKTIQVIEKELG